MTTTREAIWSGISRGLEMGTRPDPTRLRELSAEAASVQYTAAAWSSTGETFNRVMTGFRLSPTAQEASQECPN